MVRAIRHKVFAARRRSGLPIARRLGGLTLLLALLTGQTAVAQSVTLVDRQTTQRGNFAVGVGASGDSGVYLLNLDTLEPAFSNVVSDSGSAAGAEARFSTSQGYSVSDDGVAFSGSALTTVEGPPGVVSFSDALSQLQLQFVLTEATPFELRVELVEELGDSLNGAAPRADAQFWLTGPGNSWIYNTPGSFVQTGVLAAGTWRIYAFADARGNGDAAFFGTLALTPVPEPSAWLLMALGMAAMGLRRAAVAAGASNDTGSTAA